MHFPTVLRAVAFTLLAVLTLPTSVSAKRSEWTDQNGEKFKAEPSEALGPLAVFKVGNSGSRLVPLHSLSAEACQRFYREAAVLPARADRWTDAKSSATASVLKKVSRVERGGLVPADLSGLPEPEILLGFYGSYSNGESWALVGSFLPAFERIQRVYPGRLAVLFMGYNHNATNHKDIAAVTGMPWLVADFYAQSDLPFWRYRPSSGASLVAFSRHGVPLHAASANSIAEIRDFSDALAGLLWKTSTSNPAAWAGLLHYANITRPLEFAQGDAPPLLIGSPFQPAGLGQRGVKRVDASLEVNADSSVANVTLLPTSEIPEPLRAPLLNALTKNTVFSPAIRNGEPVAGTYPYSLTIPPTDARLAADIAWLQIDNPVNIAFKSWLVLRPVQVSEEAFNSTVDYIDADGVNVLRPLQVSDKVSRKSQVNAFNSDWFTEAGAASVGPKEGDVQAVDGTDLTWEKMVPSDGYVNLLSGISSANYCIGYAWTEFEMPADADALIGVGSDDGLRIWHNGRLVNDKWIRRVSRLDEDVVPLRLKKGKNQLLIKIQNVSGEWSFICRLRLR